MADLNDDIINYKLGKLSPQEMHALERKALDDPFLADALEGAEEIPAADFAEDIVALNSRIKTGVRTDTPSRPATLWTWPLRVAAGLVLMISVGIIVFSLYHEGQPEQLVLNDAVRSPVPESPAKIVPDSSSTAGGQASADLSSVESESVTPPAAEPAAAPLKSKSSPKELAKKPEPLPSVAQADRAPVTELAEEEVAEELKEEAPAENDLALSRKADDVKTESLRANDAPVEQADKFAREKKSVANVAPSAGYANVSSDSVGERKPGLRKAAIAAETIKGQVFDASGLGLPGVNVMIKGSNIGTVTDATGNYEISTPQNDATLSFSFIGYTNIEVETAGKKEVNVSLDEDVSQLSEVVVTGYGIQKEQEDITVPVELASPVGGRKAFKQYLERNLQYPEKAIENKVEGKVTIQFAVEQNGQLTEFRILKGIGDGCDEEVIRLIKSGPKWNPTRRDNEILRGIVKVRMKFQLPKK